VTPDGTLIAEVNEARPGSKTDETIRHGGENETQIARLPNAVVPAVIVRPASDERIEVDIDAQPGIRFAFDLSGAVVDVSGGAIVITLLGGGEIVLSGEVVDRFLAGDGSAFEQFLMTAAGSGDTAQAPSEVLPATDLTGSRFEHAAPATSLGSGLQSAGGLGATMLNYSATQPLESPRGGAETVEAKSSNSPPAVGADRLVTMAEDSGDVALGIGLPTDADGDALTITVTSIPNSGIGAVFLSDDSSGCVAL
jgi:hypothetical protein